MLGGFIRVEGLVLEEESLAKNEAGIKNGAAEKARHFRDAPGSRNKGEEAFWAFHLLNVLLGPPIPPTSFLCQPVMV